MRRDIRRVVTGHNAEGKSCFIYDGTPPHVYQRSPGSSIVTELWETRTNPADNRGSDDPTLTPFRLPPSKNGSKFRVIHYPPDKERLAALHKEHESAADDGSGRAAALDRANAARHPGFHKTNSIDYAIVLSGEIYALMEEGEVLLKQGDVLVQRGTNHAWSNRSDEPAVLAFVLIDAEPL
jgi:mannose-6-phosphate isomerase-like protein (cupin superfamily)